MTWELQSVALVPDSEADYKGCFSGTAMEHDGKHILAYTGVTNNGTVDIQSQCIAIGDGQIYKKWTYKGLLDSSKDGLSNMWECPDVSIIDGKDVLFFSPQEVIENEELGFHSGNNSIYVTGTLDYENCRFIREVRPENGYTAALVDYGIDFYAPETTKLKDGRTILIGWMQAWESYITPKNYIWSGMMTLPRELSFKNNRLYQKPVRELENWKTELREGLLTGVTTGGTKPGSVKNDERIIKKITEKRERHFEIDLDFTAAKGSLKMILGDEAEQVILEINTEEGFISFDRSNSSVPGAIPFRKVKLRTDGEVENLQVICDTCSLEVFINDGVMTFTNTFFFEKPYSDFAVENSTSKNISYTFWKIEKKN